ncbi:MAG: pantetheine-phosphate adenylyltransferase [Bacteroidales bacterium]|nr:pantetheine-phosphate adenylyltransferase [Bacteroidales bacterium]
MDCKKPKIAVYAGSFDPITIGHESVIRRALPLFDKIIVAIGENNLKKNLFSLEQRAKWIKTIFDDEQKIEVQTYQGLTVDFCRTSGANFLLRGLRNAADFEFECSIGQINRKIGDIETVFLLSEPELSPIQSSIVRDIYQHGGNVSAFISPKICLEE